MKSENSVTLLGNLGRDPAITSLPNGDKVANLSLATSESWKKDGNWQERTEWHRVVIFNQYLIKAIEGAIKGQRIYLSGGALQTRKWQDTSGADRYSTEVVFQRYSGNIILIDKNSEPKAGPLMVYDLDDEIPF